MMARGMGSAVGRAGRYRARGVLAAGFLLCSGALVSMYAENNRFAYDGDMLVRGFYLSRDLPLARVQSEPCPTAGAPNTASTVVDPTQNATEARSRCSERQDFLTSRLRLNANFSPNLYTDVYYGIQVGELVFGRDQPGLVGPASGGKGSGAVNVQTRELRLRLHDEAKTTYLDAGIFPVGSPAGIILATSGAGVRLEGESKSLFSAYQLVYLRQVDTSLRDGDGNGYSDETYKNVNLLYGTWKYYGWERMNLETFVLYRRDAEEYDANRVAKDISQLYWVGQEQRYSKGAVSVMCLGIANLGVVSSTKRVDLTGGDRFVSFVEDSRMTRTESISVRRLNPVTAYQLDMVAQGDAAFPGSRSRYPVRSGAGQFELALRLSEGTTLALGGATGTGRLGPEPDGRDTEYRADRFRTANSGFQYTDIAVDTSGGYTIFRGGALTGLRVWSFQLRQKVSTTLDSRIMLSRIAAQNELNGDYNQAYGWWKGPGSAHLGNEADALVEWRPVAQLVISWRAAIFLPGRGYRFLMDAEHGSAVREASFSILQRF